MLAGASIAIIPILVVYLFANKQFIAGTYCAKLRADHANAYLGQHLEKCDIVTKKKAAKIEGEKVKRFLNNLKFKSKILFIVGALFFVTATVGGITYYHYAAQDVEKNFKAGAEDVLTQLTDTLDLRLNAVEMRVRGLVSNTTFMRTMVNYLNKPDEKNRVKGAWRGSQLFKGSGESGESLVHSSYIYTDKGDFENFVRMRNWSFAKNKKFYQAYQEQGVLAVQWFPTQKDEIFKDEDDVIPYVRRFTLDGYYRWLSVFSCAAQKNRTRPHIIWKIWLL